MSDLQLLRDLHATYPISAFLNAIRGLRPEIPHNPFLLHSWKRHEQKLRTFWNKLIPTCVFWQDHAQFRSQGMPYVMDLLNAFDSPVFCPKPHTWRKDLDPISDKWLEYESKSIPILFSLVKSLVIDLGIQDLNSNHPALNQPPSTTHPPALSQIHRLKVVGNRYRHNIQHVLPIRAHTTHLQVLGCSSWLITTEPKDTELSMTERRKFYLQGVVGLEILERELQAEDLMALLGETPEEQPESIRAISFPYSKNTSNLIKILTETSDQLRGIFSQIEELVVEGWFSEEDIEQILTPHLFPSLKRFAFSGFESEFDACLARRERWGEWLIRLHEASEKHPSLEHVRLMHEGEDILQSMQRHLRPDIQKILPELELPPKFFYK